MSTRTTSFFDQDHRKPRPGPWTRRPYTSHANLHPHQSETPPNAATLITPPPIPANEQAKSKLRAFQFTTSRPEETCRTEERTLSGNEGKPDASSHAAQPATSASRGGGSNSSSSTYKTPNLPHANTFPCTPGARLPLEDLIGNCDEPQKGEPEHCTPEEHISWNPKSSSASFTPNLRKRKRAKSSSPSCPNSSSQPETNSAFCSDITKTPAADPATDLWQRYASGNQASAALKLPGIGDVLLQGSPRPMETPVKSGPFRRWASTGSVLTESKSKRRRTNARSSINVWQDETPQESNGKSKVAAMVQKIQQSLASQQLEQERSAETRMQPVLGDMPSSSSPLPETGAEIFTASAAVSPLQVRPPNLKSPAKVQSPLQAPGMKMASQNFNIRSTQSGGIRSESYKHAGDPLNPTAIGPLHLRSKAPLPAYKRPSITRPPSQPKVPQLPPPPSIQMHLDDFGDDAFDLTADDLDELLSQKPLEQRPLYDIPPHPDRSRSVQSPERLQKAPITKDDGDDNDDDEFACDDIDEELFAQAELSATQAHRTSPPKRSSKKNHSSHKHHTTDSNTNIGNQSSCANRRLQRYVVKQVVDGEYTDDKSRRVKEKVLLAEDERTNSTTAITLRGSWVATSVSTRDIVHIAHVPRFHENADLVKELPGQVMVSDEEWSPFLIVHPDHMLSATTVADSFDCIRKAVLQDRVKATGETTKAMVYGKILHEIFQQALSVNQWNDVFLADLVERTIQAHAEGLWELGMRDTNLASEEVKAKMGELAAWANIFVAQNPADNSLVEDRQGEKVWMSINKLIAVEEHVWSPQFGLKGNVDATVQTTLVDNPNEPARKLIVPFEIKTGRTTQSPAHRAQTALYTLLLSDRYDVAVEAGILYYLESSSMTRIAPPLMEVRQMIQQRNRLSSYIFKARHPPHASKDEDSPISDERPAESQEIEESSLPTVLKNPFKCGRCYAQGSCFTYHALVENGTASSAGMMDDQKKNHSLVWKEIVGHLLSSTEHVGQAAAFKKWFAKWDRLLTFEESDQSRLRKELWTMSSNERESLGRCFGNLVLTRDFTNTATSITTQVLDGIEGSGGKINRYAYVLERTPSAAAVSFTEGSQLTAGEPVVVSSEKGQWALANGYIIAVAKHEITVAVDRKLGRSRDRLVDFDSKRNQAFRGAMTVDEREEDFAALQDQPMLYRLDKDEFSNGLALIRNNLITLMSTHPIHAKLREQIVTFAKPSFNSGPPSVSRRLQPTQLGEMNEDQQSAVDKVLSAQDYALILGMPGTGKTTTIAHVIRALLADGNSILLTSFTHTAVDNILLKIRSIVPSGRILRLGVPAKINHQVQEFCLLAATPRKTIEEIEDAYMRTKIVATTCMGTNHAIFQRRTFDVCIVDEASQITLPTILGPLLKARKFVLVGDHFQLPPLVQNKAALEGGLDVSLFRQLSEQQPESVSALGRQYRMCEEIMALSNELIYDGKLKCGNEAVANRTLHIHENAALALDRFHRATLGSCSDESTCWLAHLTHPQQKVVFANTDTSGNVATETLTSGKNITNQFEATLSAQLVLSLLTTGVPASDIGVITLYRSQLALIREVYRRAGITRDVEIDSADRFQGRDKECIILSMVRSNEAGIVGELLKDWRRVNVALTRARSKLIVLGSRRTLQNNVLLSKFLALVDQKKWSMDLPTNASELHCFNLSTQVTQSLPTADRSPEKKSPGQLETSKATAGSTLSKRGPLQTSSPNIGVNGSSGPRRIHGKGGRMAEKLRLAREEIAVDIFEDLTGEEF